MPGSPIEQGSIVWALVRDPRGGNPKRRPIVIIAHTDEIVLDAEIVGVAITTSFPDPPRALDIPIPWSTPRHPVTGLARRSAAVCDWLVRVRPSEVVQVMGRLPDRYLLQIVKKVAEANPDK